VPVRQILVGAACCFAGCASSPPAIPTNQSLQELYAGSEVEGFTCGQIWDRQRELSEAIRKAELAINADRPRNQVALYFATLFVLPIVATEMNEDERGIVAHAQTEMDLLRYAAKIKQCN
jgi:hypothetical protein